MAAREPGQVREEAALSDTVHAPRGSLEGADRGGSDSDRATPVLHKEILGSKCQNLMYVHLTLDSSYNIVGSELERCTLVSQEAYDAQSP